MKYLQAFTWLKTILKFFQAFLKMGFEIRGKTQPNVKYDKSDSIITESYNMTMRTQLIVRYDVIAVEFGQKSF